MPNRGCPNIFPSSPSQELRAGVCIFVVEAQLSSQACRNSYCEVRIHWQMVQDDDGPNERRVVLRTHCPCGSAMLDSMAHEGIKPCNQNLRKSEWGCSGHQFRSFASEARLWALAYTSQLFYYNQGLNLLLALEKVGRLLVCNGARASQRQCLEESVDVDAAAGLASWWVPTCSDLRLTVGMPAGRKGKTGIGLPDSEGTNSVTHESFWRPFESDLGCCECCWHNDFWVMAMISGLTPLIVRARTVRLIATMKLRLNLLSKRGLDVGTNFDL